MDSAGADAPMDSLPLPTVAWTTLRVDHNPLDGLAADHTAHRPYDDDPTQERTR
jgi:hypothetical protein